MKKMKKRRELDALVNGKLGRKKTNGHHELLRGESESSDVEEFSIPEQTVVRKRSARTSRFCVACLMGCGMFLLLACMVAIIGLVWVHVELKRNVDQLQAKFRKLESGSQSNPEEFQELHTKQQQIDLILHDLQSGETGLDNLNTKITNAMKQISVLNVTTNSLSKSLATAPHLAQLPETVQALSKETADMGANLRSLKEDVTTLQTHKSALTSEVEELATKVNTLVLDGMKNVTDNEDGIVQDNLSSVRTQVERLNERLGIVENKTKNTASNHEVQLSSLIEGQSNVEQLMKSIRPRVEDLEKEVKEFKSKITQENIQQVPLPSATTSTTVDKHSTTSPATITLASSEEDVTPNDEDLTTAQSESNSSGKKETTKEAEHNYITLPWVHSQEDVYINFQRWDRDGDGEVRYEDLTSFLGPNLPEEEELQKYDSNSDKRYTIDEIMAAFGYSHYEKTTGQTVQSTTPRPLPTPPKRDFPFHEKIHSPDTQPLGVE